MNGYGVVLAAGAEADLDGFSGAELEFILAHIETLSRRPAAYSERAGPLTSPDGGMQSRAVMPTGGDATYFLVNFRYSADETSIIVRSIDVYRPPVEESEDSD